MCVELVRCCCCLFYLFILFLFFCFFSLLLLLEMLCNRLSLGICDDIVASSRFNVVCCYRRDHGLVMTEAGYHLLPSYKFFECTLMDGFIFHLLVVFHMLH